MERDWFNSGSDITCENQLKDQLRDPKSYEINGDFITTSNDGERRYVVWRFRSKNGFGGYVSSTAGCVITKDNGGTVKAIVIKN
jgi:hypothetical protein